MVNQPELVVPHHHVWIEARAVNVGEKRVHPDYLGGGQRVDRFRVDGRVECHGAVKKMQSEVEAFGFSQEFLDFLIGFRDSEKVVEVEEDKFGSAELERLGHETAYEFGYETLRAVAGSEHLDGISEAVVSFAESRKGAALSQRNDISCEFLSSQFHIV